MSSLTAKSLSFLIAGIDVSRKSDLSGFVQLVNDPQLISTNPWIYAGNLISACKGAAYYTDDSSIIYPERHVSGQFPYAPEDLHVLMDLRANQCYKMAEITKSRNSGCVLTHIDFVRSGVTEDLLAKEVQVLLSCPSDILCACLCVGLDSDGSDLHLEKYRTSQKGSVSISFKERTDNMRSRFEVLKRMEKGCKF